MDENMTNRPFNPDGKRFWLMGYYDGRRLKEIMRMRKSNGPTPYKELVNYERNFFETVAYEAKVEVA